MRQTILRGRIRDSVALSGIGKVGVVMWTHLQNCAVLKSAIIDGDTTEGSKASPEALRNSPSHVLGGSFLFVPIPHSLQKSMEI